MLDNWYTNHIHRRRHLVRSYQSHKNDFPTQLATSNQTNQSHQLTLNDYMDYEEIAAFVSCPGPINTDETLRLVGGNVAGVKSFVNNDKLGSDAVTLIHLQAGSAHKYEFRNSADNIFRTEFGAARVEFDTSSEKVETTHCKRGGHILSCSGTMGPLRGGNWESSNKMRVMDLHDLCRQSQKTNDSDNGVPRGRPSSARRQD
jgi:hypothetical protein